MMKATRTQKKVPAPMCDALFSATPPTTSCPRRGNVVWPRTPMAAQARHDATVNQTTHGFLRRRASETAPSRGTDTTTRKDAMPLPTAYKVLDACKSATSQTEKYKV